MHEFGGSDWSLQFVNDPKHKRKIPTESKFIVLLSLNKIEY